MSNFNHKGPQNDGPMTGRGLGYCASDKLNKEDQNFGQKPRLGLGNPSGFSRGMGMGRAFGRGRCGRGMGQRFGTPNVQDIDAEIQNLENLKKQLQANGK